MGRPIASLTRFRGDFGLTFGRLAPPFISSPP
jgi:hypothetical protein